MQYILIGEGVEMGTITSNFGGANPAKTQTPNVLLPNILQRIPKNPGITAGRALPPEPLYKRVRKM